MDRDHQDHMNNNKVSIEAPVENQIYEITFDGTEIYQP